MTTLLNPYFGEFGGMYVPQILMPALRQLEEAFVSAQKDPEFQAQFNDLLSTALDAAHEAAVAANVAMLMRLHGHEDLQANAQTVLEVLRSGSAYDRVTALAARG